jgi:outer membrane cobalamin receptor
MCKDCDGRVPMTSLGRTVAAALALVLGHSVGTLHAQEEPLRQYTETVVVTATADPIVLAELPREVTILTAQEIANLPLRTVTDLLSYAAGVDVRARGPFGAQADFSMRGSTFSQVAILIDGVRINDAQTGHHNGDIPIPLSAIDRVEIVHGSGSSLHGADAVGGTVNIITKRATASPELGVSVGSFGLVEADANAGASAGRAEESASLSIRRSSGFAFDRELADVAASSRTSVGDRTTLLVGVTRKAFGANGFYGPSPSKEWTDQTFVSFTRTLLDGTRWKLSGVAAYRTHGDRFLWDVRQPNLFESRHRTHAATGLLTAQHTISERTHVSLGTEMGSDWIRSNTLGDDSFQHASAFVELRRAVGSGSWLYPAVRYDAYSAFGSSVSPSIGVASSLTRTVKLRGSLGRAFRIPSFTERYYRDPVHRADASLQPEHAWTAEAGVDWLARSVWLVNASVFRRWDSNLIDWVRPTSDVPWRSSNIRLVRTDGFDVQVQRPAAAGGTFAFHYEYLDVKPDALSLLSLYTLDFARHRAGVSTTLSLPAGLVAGQRLEVVQRVGAPRAWLWDGRLSRSFGRLEASVEASNLLDAHYQEVRGVDMPGRWLRGSLRVKGL